MAMEAARPLGWVPRKMELANPRFELVDPRKIKFDYSYQRPQNKLKVDLMATQFDLALVGTIDVSERADGSLYCYDGGHRVQAALKAGIRSVPCLIHIGLTVEDEAERWSRQNVIRTKPNTYQRFRSDLRRGDPVAVAINHACLSIGVLIGEKNAPGMTRAVDALGRVYRMVGDAGLAVTLETIVMAYPNDAQALRADVLLAIGSFIYIYRDYPGYKPDRLVGKLAELPVTWLIQRRVTMGAMYYSATNKVDSAGARVGVEAYNRDLRSARLPEFTMSHLRRLALGQNPWASEK